VLRSNPAVVIGIKAAKSSTYKMVTRLGTDSGDLYSMLHPGGALISMPPTAFGDFLGKIIALISVSVRAGNPNFRRLDFVCAYHDPMVRELVFDLVDAQFRSHVVFLVCW
jgi:hypothetical protein